MGPQVANKIYVLINALHSNEIVSVCVFVCIFYIQFEFKTRLMSISNFLLNSNQTATLRT